MSARAFLSRFITHALAVCAVVVAVQPVSSITAFAQQAQADGIRGRVLDPDGRPVVNAIVIARNEADGQVQTQITDGQGAFQFTAPSGAYTLEVSVPGFELVERSSIRTSAESVDIRLSIANISESVTVSAALPAAAVAAPSQGSLTARSAQSLISNEYIRNYTSPVSDYSQVLQMAPGTFSVSANGPGLGDTKTFFRGFKDGYYSMTFDGIPFNDTNDPTHHSWVFFPAQTIGSTVFDRSPGSASSIGPSTFGGSVNFLSPGLSAQQRINGTVSYGSFNTRLLDLSYDSGRFDDGKMRLSIEGHQMTSDGYQTFNFQNRKAFSAKYAYAVNDNVQVTGFSSVVDLHANTPNQKGSTRAQLEQFGNNFLMTDDPTSPLYYKFNFYHVPTDFEYAGVKANLGGGWSIDDKVYRMQYHNKQNYNGTTTISATSATDKLNSYWKVGNILPVTHISEHGVFHGGLWLEHASTDRYQTPSDPRTWVDGPLPNFHEKFITTTMQPYAEYELQVGSRLRVTPGVKLARYTQDFTQFADGKTVGNLNGAPFVTHAVTYSTWLPSIDAHVRLQDDWSAYGQYGKGQNIPPTSIFDVKGAQVATLPKPTLTDTVQFGTVWKSSRATLDVDAYHIHYQNDYSSATDAVTGDTNWYFAGSAATKGVEAESTILVGGGLAVYLNATKGSAKYDSGAWVQNAPKDTETLGLTYNSGNWNFGFFNKRVGSLYNDNGAVHEAFSVDPFNITNLFFNYTLRGSSRLSQSRIRLAVNNLTDSHAITGVPTGGTAKSTTASPSPNDVLTVMPGRSVSVSFTVGFSPNVP